MSSQLQSLTVDDVPYPNPAVFKMDKPKKVVATYVSVTFMSLVVKNPGATDKKILVTSSVEYTIPANGSTTIQIKSGDTLILE